MKQKLAVFPYDSELSCLWKYSDLLQEYEIGCLIVPRGCGLTDQEIPVLSNGQMVSVKVQDEFSRIESNSIDAIWITEGINRMDRNIAIKMVDVLLDMKKKILYTSTICDEVKDIILRSNMSLNLSETNGDKNELSPSTYQYPIDVPVIMVLSTSIMTEKFEVQLSIRKRLQEKGYKVAHVGTKSFCNLFGSHPIPDWFFDRKYTEAEKISLFNILLKNIEKEEKPDAIVVGVPEGIIPLTKKHHFNYGVYAFEICCAVAPDYVILALPYGEYNDEFYEEMKILCQYRLNTRLDSFYVSSYQPISNSFTKPSLEFTQSNGVITHDAKYTVFRDTDDRLLAEHIIKKLTMYDEYQIM